MPNVVIDGGVIRLTAGSLFGWGDSEGPPPAANLGNYIDVPLTGTAEKITEDGVKAVLWADVVTAMNAVTDTYHSSICGFWTNNTVPGYDGTLLAATLIPTAVSTHMINIGAGVLLDNAFGSFTVVVTVPAALGVASGPVVLDLVNPHAGTWAVQSHGQVGPSLVATI